MENEDFFYRLNVPAHGDVSAYLIRPSLNIAGIAPCACWAPAGQAGTNRDGRSVSFCLPLIPFLRILLEHTMCDSNFRSSAATTH